MMFKAAMLFLIGAILVTYGLEYAHSEVVGLCVTLFGFLLYCLAFRWLLLITRPSVAEAAKVKCATLNDIQPNVGNGDFTFNLLWLRSLNYRNMIAIPISNGYLQRWPMINDRKEDPAVYYVTGVDWVGHQLYVEPAFAQIQSNGMMKVAGDEYISAWRYRWNDAPHLIWTPTTLNRVPIDHGRRTLIVCQRHMYCGFNEAQRSLSRTMEYEQTIFVREGIYGLNKRRIPFNGIGGWDWYLGFPDHLLYLKGKGQKEQQGTIDSYPKTYCLSAPIPDSSGQPYQNGPDDNEPKNCEVHQFSLHDVEKTGAVGFLAGIGVGILLGGCFVAHKPQ
jgi:hypothetical protein